MTTGVRKQIIHTGLLMRTIMTRRKLLNSTLSTALAQHRHLVLVVRHHQAPAVQAHLHRLAQAVALHQAVLVQARPVLVVQVAPVQAYLCHCQLQDYLLWELAYHHKLT